jgi:hypothetical protein
MSSPSGQDATEQGGASAETADKIADVEAELKQAPPKSEDQDLAGEGASENQGEESEGAIGPRTIASVLSPRIEQIAKCRIADCTQALGLFVQELVDAELDDDIKGWHSSVYDCECENVTEIAGVLIKSLNADKVELALVTVHIRFLLVDCVCSSTSSCESSCYRTKTFRNRCTTFL